MTETNSTKRLNAFGISRGAYGRGKQKITKLFVPRSGMPSTVSLAYPMVVLTVLLFASVGKTSTAQAQDRYLTTNFSLQDANVAKLQQRLKLIGITLPLELQGNVTTSLRIGVPLHALRSAEEYRIDGTLTSDRLLVSGLDLRQLTLN